jgi:hypothetical protein
VAVYSGARPRSTFLPQRSRVIDTPTLPRRRVRGAVRARRRTNRLAFVLGGIVLVFLLAFFSLAQTVRVSATGYDLERLGRERDARPGELRTHEEIVEHQCAFSFSCACPWSWSCACSWP